MGFVEKFLPHETQQLIQYIRKDKALENDLVASLTEVEKALADARQGVQSDKRLKEAFNDVSSSLSAAKHFLAKGDVPGSFAIQFGFNRKRFENSFKTFSDCFQTNHPAANVFLKSLEQNSAFRDSFKKVASKTNGSLFKLEPGANGDGFLVVLLGKGQKFSIDKAHFANAQRALGQPPAPPSV